MSPSATMPWMGVRLPASTASPTPWAPTTACQTTSTAITIEIGNSNPAKNARNGLGKEFIFMRLGFALA